MEWYFMCYNTVNYSIIVNSNPIDFISLKWSLRQGDPLSPLYLICVHNQPLTNQHNVEEIYMVQRFVEEHIVFHICILHMMIWYPFLSGIRVGSWIFTIALLMKQIQVGQFFFFYQNKLNSYHYFKWVNTRRTNFKDIGLAQEQVTLTRVWAAVFACLLTNFTSKSGCKTKIDLIKKTNAWNSDLPRVGKEMQSTRVFKNYSMSIFVNGYLNGMLQKPKLPLWELSNLQPSTQTEHEQIAP